MAFQWSVGKRLFLGFGCATLLSAAMGLSGYYGVKGTEAIKAEMDFVTSPADFRNLAQRAAEAAKNTSNLIEATIQAVRQGRELTSNTQEAFQENVEIAGKVSQLVEEIAAASQEQARGIEQISQAVAQMDKVVQATAASAEQSASASEELQAQAQAMKDLVGDLVRLVEASKTARLQLAKGNGESELGEHRDDNPRVEADGYVSPKAIKAKEKKREGEGLGRNGYQRVWSNFLLEGRG